MAESEVSLRKKSRMELLEMLVEQGRHVAEMNQQMEEMKAELAEKTAALDDLNVKLEQKNSDIHKCLQSMKDFFEQMKDIINNKNKEIESLKSALETEKKMRIGSITSCKTLGEATRYMNRMMEDTKTASLQYQKMIGRLSKQLDKK